MMDYDTRTMRRQPAYVGPDKDGFPLHVGELVVYVGEIWRLGPNTISRLSADERLPLVQVGTMNLMRA